jgi:hypothetical protein
MACFRTSRLVLVRATLISSGTPSDAGIWLRAKTARFLTSVSGSFSIRSVIAPAALRPPSDEPEDARCARRYRWRSWRR